MSIQALQQRIVPAPLPEEGEEEKECVCGQPMKTGERIAAHQLPDGNYGHFIHAACSEAFRIAKTEARRISGRSTNTFPCPAGCQVELINQPLPQTLREKIRQWGPKAAVIAGVFSALAQQFGTEYIFRESVLYSSALMGAVLTTQAIRGEEEMPIGAVLLGGVQVFAALTQSPIPALALLTTAAVIHKHGGNQRNNRKACAILGGIAAMTAAVSSYYPVHSVGTSIVTAVAAGMIAGFSTFNNPNVNRSIFLGLQYAPAVLASLQSGVSVAAAGALGLLTAVTAYATTKWGQEP